MGKKRTWNEIVGSQNYKLIYNRIKNLALNRFEWTGLPDGIESRFIEECLFTHGTCAFANDPHIGKVALPCNISGGLNIYGEPVAVNVYGFNYNKTFNLTDEAVLIKNNMLSTSTKEYCEMFATRIEEIERSLDVNIKGQKTPYIVACNEKDLLTMKNIFKKIDGDEPVIYADQSLNIDALAVHLTPSPFVADKLADYKHDVWNEVFTFLGINNANTDKRERLVSDEVNANNEQVKYNIDFMLEQRELACQRINKLFGMNVGVRLKGGEQNESVYGDGQTDGGE